VTGFAMSLIGITNPVCNFILHHAVQLLTDEVFVLANIRSEADYQRAHV
jgi:hypothetical protein